MENYGQTTLEQLWTNIYGKLWKTDGIMFLSECFSSVFHQFSKENPRTSQARSWTPPQSLTRQKTGEILSALHGAGINISTFRLPSGSLT
jgi:hypothetical protein